MLCDNVKTYHSDSGFVGGFVILDSGQISNEGSTIPTRPGTVRKRQRSDCLRHALVGAHLRFRPGTSRPRSKTAVPLLRQAPSSPGTVVDARCRSAMELA